MLPVNFDLKSRLSLDTDYISYLLILSERINTDWLFMILGVLNNTKVSFQTDNLVVIVILGITKSLGTCLTDSEGKRKIIYG